MSFSRVDTVILRVSDLAASTAWYVETIGFTVAFEDPGERLAVLQGSEGSPITLWEWKPGEKRPAPGGASCYPIFASKNAVEDARALRDRGVRVDEVVDQRSICFFRFYDPDGNMLEACEVRS